MTKQLDSTNRSIFVVGSPLRSDSTYFVSESRPRTNIDGTALEEFAICDEGGVAHIRGTENCQRESSRTCLGAEISTGI
jgi:hypothetical protein